MLNNELILKILAKTDLKTINNFSKTSKNNFYLCNSYKRYLAKKFFNSFGIYNINYIGKLRDMFRLFYDVENIIYFYPDTVNIDYSTYPNQNGYKILIKNSKKPFSIINNKQLIFDDTIFYYQNSNNVDLSKHRDKTCFILDNNIIKGAYYKINFCEIEFNCQLLEEIIRKIYKTKNIYRSFTDYSFNLE